MFVRPRLLDRCTATDRRQLRLRRVESHTGCEHAEYLYGWTRTRRMVETRRAQRSPEVVRDRECEAFAHHTDDGRGLGSKLHALAKHTRIAAEARSPDLIAEHRHRRGTVPL